MFLCLVFLMLLRLFIAALWSPVTCWERAELFTLVGDVYCIFVAFPCGILGQVWYWIILFPDLCLVSYFHILYISRICTSLSIIMFELDLSFSSSETGIKSPTIIKAMKTVV